MADKITAIWQVTSSKSWGGRESIPVALHDVFGRRGIESRLFCSRTSSLAERHGDRPGVTVLPFEGILHRKARGLLSNELKNHTPQAVICHFSHDLPLLRLVLGKRAIPRLILIKHVGPGKSKRDLVHRWVYRHVHRVLGVSEYVARRCRETYPIKGDQVGVWHPGVDVEEKRFNPERRSRIRQKLGLSEDDILFGYIARHTPAKGHSDLAAAFATLAALRDDVYLALPGSASPNEQDFADRLNAIIDGTPAGQRVFRPGFVEDISGWLSAFDIFINPSPRESFGLNTVEAMAAARPVIAVAGGGTPDIVAHEENGLLIDPNSTDQLISAMAGLAGDADMRQRLGRAALATARGRFSLDTSVDRLLTLIR